jgi:glycerol-3-phosphate dehydrogenase subunit C
VATYDPNESRYWDEADLAAETDRIFDVCNGCRLCYNLCPSFPTLFEAFDAADDAGERALAPAVKERVADLCFQCKVCYDVCPYKPPHRFDLDFPRLILRQRAQRARRHGVRRSDRFLGDPDRTGRLATGAMAPLANWSVGLKPVRRLMEGMVGVDRRRRLPRFARVTFRRWFRQRRAAAPAMPAGAVAAADAVTIFATCLVNYQHPEVGRAAVRVLEHNGVAVSLADAEVCCGMPALDGGDMARAQALARANVAALLPAVRAGRRVVVPEPTCGFMLKKEYPLLVGTAEAREVAEATLDLVQYLAQRARAGALRTEFPGPVPTKITYHVPCHLRAQNIGAPARTVLALLPGVEVEAVERCSGMDGTWGMKRESFDLSLEVAKKLMRRVEDTPADGAVCSDCALAGLQIEQLGGRTVRHPVEILARAYGLTDDEDDAREREGERA